MFHSRVYFELKAGAGGRAASTHKVWPHTDHLFTMLLTVRGDPAAFESLTILNFSRSRMILRCFRTSLSFSALISSTTAGMDSSILWVAALRFSSELVIDVPVLIFLAIN